MTSGVKAAIGMGAATQAQMEAATSNAAAVTPLSAKWHPGVAKAWVEGNSSGTIAASYNVSSVTNNATGNCTVNLSITLSSNAYANVASGSGASGAMTSSASNDATSVGVLTYDTSAALANAAFSLAIFGDV